MKKSVSIAADVDPMLLRLLGRDGRFIVSYSPATNEEELIQRAAGAQILVTRYHNRVTRRVLEAGARLELIAQGTSGTDNIDEAAAASIGIPIVSTPGENANSVAELVMAHMISLSRTVPFYDAQVRAGIWRRDDCASRLELRGRHLGIAGLGRVGTRVASLAAAFGMKVSAYDPYLQPEDFDARGAVKVGELDDLVRSCDILTLHVPLTTETRGFIGERRIALLQKGAILINACRGEVVDLTALLEALGAKRLGGVALDVYPQEPPLGIEWPDDPNLILTPHIGGCTRQAKASIGVALYRSICAHYAIAPLEDPLEE